MDLDPPTNLSSIDLFYDILRALSSLHPDLLLKVNTDITERPDLWGTHTIHVRLSRNRHVYLQEAPRDPTR